MSRNQPQSTEKPEPVPAFFSVRLRWSGTLTATLGLAWATVCFTAFYRMHTKPFFSLEHWISIWPPLIDLMKNTWAHHLPPVAWFIAFVVCAGAVGHGGLKCFTLDVPLNFLERWAFSYGLGVGIWGLLMFALALTGLLRPAVMHSVLSAVVVLFWWLGRRAGAVEVLEVKNLWEGVSLPLGVFAVVAHLLIGVYALSPEIWYDSLVYHLALPALYKMEGAMVPTPTMSYSGIPLHMEMLYLWALNGGGTITAKLIHWSLGVGVSLAILGFFVRRGTPWAGWVASVMFLSMPMTGFIYSRTFIDGGSVFFVLLAALALTILVEQSARAARPQRLVVLGAFFIGIAMAIKYPNGPMFVAFLAALAMSRLVSWKHMAAFVVVAAACVTPWLIKNAAFYNNPVFPFFHDWWFPASTTPIDWRLLKADAGSRDWGAIFASGGRPLWEAVIHPWLLTMKVSNSADFLGILPLVSLPGLFVLKPVSPGAKLWYRVFLGGWLVWFLTTSMPRMFFPGLALLAVIGGVALAQLAKRWLWWATGVTVLLVSVNNLSFTARAMSRMDASAYLSGATSEADYLRVSHPTYPRPDYTSREWINLNTPPSARVLVVGDARGYYLERPFQTASVFDTDPFWLVVDESSDAEDVFRRLTNQGFTHLLVNIGEILRLNRGCPSTKPGSLELAEEFFKSHARIRFGERTPGPQDFRWSVVYEIVSSPLEATDNAVLIDLYRSLKK